VQAAVDAKYHLVVISEVTNVGVELGQLAPMAQSAKAELGIEQAAVVADGGYFKAEDIKVCQEMQMEPHLAEIHSSPSERAGLYGKKDFQYEAEQDLYRCPAGKELHKRRELIDKGRRLFNYDNRAACAQCPLKARCTQSEYRTVSRWEHEECLQRMAALVKAQPEKLAKREAVIEHCWGTIKWLLKGGFLLKGLRKVRAEMSLAHLVYNLKRALNIVGLAKLMEAIG